MIMIYETGMIQHISTIRTLHVWELHVTRGPLFDHHWFIKPEQDWPVSVSVFFVVLYSFREEKRIYNFSFARSTLVHAAYLRDILVDWYVLYLYRD